MGYLQVFGAKLEELLRTHGLSEAQCEEIIEYVKDIVLQSYRNGTEKGRSESAPKHEAGPTQSVEADSDTVSVRKAPHSSTGAGFFRAWVTALDQTCGTSGAATPTHPGGVGKRCAPLPSRSLSRRPQAVCALAPLPQSDYTRHKGGHLALAEAVISRFDLNQSSDVRAIAENDGGPNMPAITGALSAWNITPGRLESYLLNKFPNTDSSGGTYTLPPSPKAWWLAKLWSGLCNLVATGKWARVHGQLPSGRSLVKEYPLPSTPSVGQPDIYELIETEHKIMTALLERALNAHEAPERERLVSDAGQLILLHELFESKFFYPLLQRLLANERNSISCAYSQHADIQELLQQVYMAPITERGHLLHDLKVAIEEHSDYEEANILPQGRAASAYQDAVALGRYDFDPACPRASDALRDAHKVQVQELHQTLQAFLRLGVAEMQKMNYPVSLYIALAAGVALIAFGAVSLFANPTLISCAVGLLGCAVAYLAMAKGEQIYALRHG